MRLQRLEAAARQLPAVPAEDDDRRPPGRHALSRGGRRFQRSSISGATSARVISIVSCQCSSRNGRVGAGVAAARERERRVGRQGGGGPRERRRELAHEVAQLRRFRPQALELGVVAHHFRPTRPRSALDDAPRQRRLHGRDVRLGLLRAVLERDAVGLQLGDAVRRGA